MSDHNSIDSENDQQEVIARCRYVFLAMAKAVVELADLKIAECKAFAELAVKAEPDPKAPYQLVEDAQPRFRKLWQGVMRRQAEDDENKATEATEAIPVEVRQDEEDPTELDPDQPGDQEL